MRLITFCCLCVLIVGSSVAAESQSQHDSDAQAMVAVQQRLDEMLHKNPDDVEMAIVNARLLSARGQVAKGTLLLQWLLERHPDDDSIYFALSDMYMKDLDIAQARAILTRLLKRRPDSVRALAYMAQIYRLEDDYAAAAQCYRRIINNNQLLAKPYVELGRMYEELKQPQKALDVYEEGEKNCQRSLELAHLRTELLMQYQRYDEAETELKKLVQKYPDDGESHYRYGRLLGERCQWREAEEQLRSAVAAGIKDGLLFCMLGEVCVKQNKMDEAIAAYRQALTDKHWADEARKRLNVVYFIQKRFGEAVATLEPLLKRDDAKALQYLQLALYYQAWHKPQQALQALNAGIARFPHSADLYYARGVYYQQHGSRKQVVENMRSALKADPDHAGALNHLAYTYAEAGENLDEALKMARKAVRIKATAAVLDTLGWVYYQMGNYSQARVYLLKSLEKDDSDAQVLEHIGDVCAALGDYSAAHGYYARAVKIDGGNSRLEKKLRNQP